MTSDFWLLLINGKTWAACWLRSSCPLRRARSPQFTAVTTQPTSLITSSLGLKVSEFLTPCSKACQGGCWGIAPRELKQLSQGHTALRTRLQSEDSGHPVLRRTLNTSPQKPHGPHLSPPGAADPGPEPRRTRRPGRGRPRPV